MTLGRRSCQKICESCISSHVKSTAPKRLQTAIVAASSTLNPSTTHGLALPDFLSLTINLYKISFIVYTPDLAVARNSAASRAPKAKPLRL